MSTCQRLTEPPALPSHQETFWRIPERLSPAQLRGAAAALTQGEELPAGGQEPQGPGSPRQEPQEEPQEEEEEVGASSNEQRSEAIRALLLSRMRKPRSKEADGGFKHACNTFQPMSILLKAPCTRCHSR